MLRLNVLGGLMLSRDGQVMTGRAAQRRRAALFALLAMEGDRGMSRDRVGAFLWPEADEDRAHHALAQLLYVVRRDLGSDDVIVGQDVLTLNRTRVAVDAAEFTAALDRHDHEAALALYQGPFLDGVHLAATVEFEQWVDAHRQRMAVAAREAADALVDRAETAGDRRAAIRWSRWRVRADPFDSRAAAALVDALASAGSFAEAMAVAERHDSLVRDELGHPPDAVFNASVRRLREARERSVSVIPGGAIGPTPAGAADARHENAPTNGRLASVRIEKIRLRIPMLAAGVLLLFGVGAAIAARWPRLSAESRARVAVLRFDVIAPVRDEFLGDAVVDLLSASLEETGTLRPADPRVVLDAQSAEGMTRGSSPEQALGVVRRVDADYFVRGSLVETGDSLRLRAELYDRRAPATAIARAVADGGKEQLFALVDRVALTLVAGRVGGVAARLEDVASRSTTSLAAVRAFVEGEVAFHAGRYQDAIDAFRQATHEDTKFALAYYRLAIAYDWAGYPYAMRDSAARAAVATSGRLPEHERMLLRAMHLSLSGEYAQAHELCRAVLTDYPHDVAAWYQLAEIEFHYNSARGRGFHDADASFRHVAELAAGDPGAPLHLARIAAFDGNRRAFDSLMAVYDSIKPGDRDPEIALMRAAVEGNRHAQDSVIAALSRMQVDTIAGAAWRVAQYALDPALTLRVVAGLAARPLADRRVGDELAAYASASRQDWITARVALDSLTAADPTRGTLLAAQLAAIPGMPVSRSELMSIRARLDSLVGRNVPVPDDRVFPLRVEGLDLARVYASGSLSARLGDRPAVERAVRELESAATGDSLLDRGRRVPAMILHAAALQLEGRSDSALTVLHRTAATGWLDAPGRYLLAALEDSAGDTAQARQWYDTFAGGFWLELAYVVPAEQALERIAARAGDRAGAQEAARRRAKVLGAAH